MSHGSLREVETHIHIAARLHYIDEARKEEVLAQCGEVGRILNGLLNSLNKNS
jgi:four helix bundle protein